MKVYLVRKDGRFAAYYDKKSAHRRARMMDATVTEAFEIIGGNPADFSMTDILGFIGQSLYVTTEPN